MRIRFSKLFASLVENSSSVSSISKQNHLVSITSWGVLYIKTVESGYQEDGIASSEGSLCAGQKVLVDRTSDEALAEYK